ncbi:hypothetical protein NEISICOT_01976 [Neisseria sicca ATCC 29256]|uniref:Lipoprotein n=1 Tax=Neisseria sicca ATCC 29256 TaxID=547045 RepID=C6M625_NEISI|nr:hypothetical protein [Neisseria sicca]EET44253.1 hypothetical protein NEISICOT_01976 [Neisseria sicca ATCC 29256]QMT37686.1 hypothetical protein H3L95_11330 [Neisseria sicca]
MSKGKYLIFIAVLFLTSCIVSFNGYELQPKNYVINKEFDEVVFDMDFINTKQKMINNLRKANAYHANCESSERTYVVDLLGFVDSEFSDIKNSQIDRLTGSVRLCSNDDRFNCIQEKFKQKRYTFKCIAVFYEGMDRGYRSKPFLIDFDTRTLKKEL